MNTNISAKEIVKVINKQLGPFCTILQSQKKIEITNVPSYFSAYMRVSYCMQLQNMSLILCLHEKNIIWNLFYSKSLVGWAGQMVKVVHEFCDLQKSHLQNIFKLFEFFVSMSTHINKCDMARNYHLKKLKKFSAMLMHNN